MDKVRIAIIGVNNIGTVHATYLAQHQIKNAELVAFCDHNVKHLATAKEKFGSQYKFYSDTDEVMKDPDIDAIIIATPHYSHPELSIAGLNAGKHVLTEKPAGVYTKNVREAINVSHEHPELTYGIMYNQRMNPVYQKARQLVQSGAIGELRRTNWIITNWYRSQSYYDSSSWRATWAGEGGGVLLNQDPHQLDLWQWICGMPKRIMSFVSFGKLRQIEVETEVTAYAEYENGATGVFVTSVTETPGTNRFEIVGSRGKIVIENNQLSFWQSVVDEQQWNQEYKGGFGEPEVWKIDVPAVWDDQTGHAKTVQNFVNHIVDGEKLVSPAADGILGLSISNAMYLSTWQQQWVDLPIDEDEYLTELKKRIATSKSKHDGQQ
ncbi:Gfo/Idh/MocA family oxidoreductase [Paucilactobacillus suebicus]|uniref:Oxidoreductase domain-containing protein n=1 Tax=Paucilactobacillus suebicus DSM 5007 = KCTC 3549 TaxID=1423807 RepID=A0A0R1WAA6_9LACO|nr:Gfo/Idh/MocA family oxidoreductase [Paucilactobacillus suebicus]KRM12006.1 oxidoreductase domain-containing protein [Paucilactobacillus suebicus DSM 5007 = KCTC 3549]